jgi:heme exporter protein C
VFAITAGAFVPLNFIAVRLSSAYLHPRVLGSTSNLPPQMALTFVVSLLAMGLLYATLYSYELTAKRTRAKLRALRRRVDSGSAAAGAGGTAPARSPRSAAPQAYPATAMTARPAGRGRV